MKWYSISQAIKELQIKTTIIFHLSKFEWQYSRTIAATNAGKVAVNQEPLYTVGGNECTLMQPLWKAVW
jgi:hypothetical protein